MKRKIFNFIKTLILKITQVTGIQELLGQIGSDVGDYKDNK